MSLKLLSLLAVVVIAVQALPARAVQDDAAAAAGSPLDKAGWEVLRQSPRLLAPDDTAAELRRILSQDEYQEAPGQQPQENWLAGQWQRLLDKLASMGFNGSGTWGAALAGLLILLVAVLVVRLLWLWATRARSESGAGEPGDGKPRTTEQLRLAAEQAAERGDYRSAIRFRYLALLRALNIPTATVMTNSQIQRRVVRRHPALAGPMRELVMSYEDCWYGGLAARPGDYERASGHARSIEELLAEGDGDERAD